ncbi:unnamed protein product [Symbiodinium microadriaticum]|nr:unnamed protein product [Symbiodinium microadriaticum]
MLQPPLVQDLARTWHGIRKDLSERIKAKAGPGGPERPEGEVSAGARAAEQHSLLRSSEVFGVARDFRNACEHEHSSSLFELQSLTRGRTATRARIRGLAPGRGGGRRRA